MLASINVVHKVVLSMKHLSWFPRSCWSAHCYTTLIMMRLKLYSFVMQSS